MQINSSVPQVQLKAINNQVNSQNEAAKKSNQAVTSFNKAPKEQKSKAAQHMSKAKQSAQSVQRSGFQQRSQQVKKATAQSYQVTQEGSKEANIFMAKIMSPPQSELSPKELGQFIDQYA
jgi:flagellum-specific peptidoglycan hydrolase FlgJ